MTPRASYFKPFASSCQREGPKVDEASMLALVPTGKERALELVGLLPALGEAYPRLKRGRWFSCSLTF